MTQELDRNQCISLTSAEIFPGGGNVQILLILYRLLTMQCKWTFRKSFTLSTHLSVLVKPQFSVICLKRFLHFGYQKCLSFHELLNIHFFEHFLQISHNLRIIKVQNNMSGEKTLSQNCFKK